MKNLKIILCNNMLEAELCPTEDSQIKETIDDLIYYSNKIINFEGSSDNEHLSVFELYVFYEKVLETYIYLMTTRKIIINNEETDKYEIISEEIYEKFIFKNGILVKETREELIKNIPQLVRLRACQEGKIQIRKAETIRNYVAHLSHKALGKVKRECYQKIIDMETLMKYLSSNKKQSKISIYTDIEETFKNFIYELFYIGVDDEL